MVSVRALPSDAALTRVVLVFVGLLAFSHASAGAGNFAVTLNEKGFAFFGDEAVTLGLQKAQGQVLPDISNQRFDCAGKCYWSISSGKIETVQCGAPSFTFVPGKGLSVKLASCSASASTNYRIHRSTFPSFSCSGGIRVDISGLNFGIELDIGVTANQTLSLNVPSAAVSLGEDKLHFSGDCKLLGDVAKKLIEKAILKAINDKLSSQLPADINKALAAHPIPRYVTADKTRLDLGVATAPAITADYLQIDLEGLFNPAGGTTVYPGTKPALPGATTPTNMVTLILSEAVLNSLTWSLAEEGLLAAKINKTVLGFDIELAVSTPTSPVVTFATNTPGTLATAAVALDATISSPKLANDTVDLGLSMSVPFNLSLSGQKLMGDISNLKMGDVNLTITLKSKTYGPFAPGILEAILTFLGDSVLLPTINKKLQAGVAIPVFKGVGFADAVLTPGAGFLKVEASFEHVKDAVRAPMTAGAPLRVDVHSRKFSTRYNPLPTDEEVVPVQVKFQK